MSGFAAVMLALAGGIGALVVVLVVVLSSGTLT
jgi:hypothetical protein